MKLNQVAHLQTEVAHAYMRRCNLRPADFVELDKQFGILHFIAEGYEPFHLTGTEGIINEIDEYIHLQCKNRRCSEAPNLQTASNSLRY